MTDQLVDEILDKDGLDLAQNPVIFHIFSGAGCISLLNMFESLRSKGIQLTVKGMVFDSAPGESTYWSKAMAYNEATATQQLSDSQKYFWSYLYSWYFWFYDYLKSYRGWMAGKHDSWSAPYFERLSKETLSPFQLYLFSKADHVCTSDSIEKFIKIQQEKQDGSVMDIKSICWLDTMHCQHLRSKRDEYLNAINELMDKLFKHGDDFVRINLP